MRDKHLMSPNDAENAVPHPHDRMELANEHKKGPTMKSPETAPMGMNHKQKTPDMMGALFDHKPNKHGV
jgi:hypothetical protein